MSNSMTGVNMDVISQQTLDTLVAELPLVSMFATDFSADVAVEGQSVSTRVVSAPTFGSLSAGYAAAAQGANIAGKKITLGDVEGVCVGFTDSEWAMSSINLTDVLIKPSVDAIAGGMVNAALGLVTYANYGAGAWLGVASDFDSDDVSDIASVLSAAKVPAKGRFMLLGTQYYTALTKDDAVKYSLNYGGTEAIRMRQIPALAGFAPVAEYVGMPENDEELVGIAGHKSGIIVATRVPATPEQFVGEIKTVADPVTGVAIQLRKWYSNDLGKHFLSCGILKGVAVGNAGALKRIVRSLENSSSSSEPVS